MRTNIIREKRLDKGLELIRVADTLGLSTRQLRRIENAECSTYNLQVLDKLSKILNIQMLDLINYLIEKEEVV